MGQVLLIMILVSATWWWSPHSNVRHAHELQFSSTMHNTRWQLKTHLLHQTNRH